MNYKNYPLFRLLIFYILGILWAYFMPLSFLNSIICCFIIAIILPLSVLLYYYLSYRWQWLPGCLLLSVFLFAGYATTNLRFSETLSSSTIKYVLSHRDYVVSVCEPPEMKANSVKVVAVLERSFEDSSILQKAILYFEPDTFSKRLSYGDRLLIHSSIEDIRAPKNPSAFDYKTFLRRKGVYYTGYVPSYAWKYAGISRVSWLKESSYKCQQFFSFQFRRAGLKGDEYSIITAILLGNDETMSPELKSDYASAGVSHILCVSGMHVGIIFMILNFILQPLEFNRISRFCKAILLLLSIWFYACITGLSPSVIRAATMFSFVTFGTLLKRNTDVFHSLYASLFLLLLLNPLLIFELGFQLSYLAVLGIVIFQPLFANILHPKTKVGNYFNALASVSLAAQVTTFPLSIFCFGQFPNYFILANLSVIALSFIVVVSGVILLSFSFCPLLLFWIGKILAFEIRGMNAIISFIDSLPGAVSDNLMISSLQTSMLYLSIFFFIVFMKKKSRFALFAFLVILTIFPFSLLYDAVKSARHKQIIVYSVPRSFAMGVYDGCHGYLLSDTNSAIETNNHNFNIKNHQRFSRVKAKWVSVKSDFEEGVMCKHGPFVKFYNKTFFLLQRGDKLFTSTLPFEVDYLLICHNPSINPSKISQIIHFKNVIIDESNSEYNRNKWALYCRENGLECYDIFSRGAFSLSLSFP